MARTEQSTYQNFSYAVPYITVGEVVDTNDPQQMGRLRVLCPALNDNEDNPREFIPWASYVAPFGGNIQVGTRGPDQDDMKGPASYGMWAIPKVGAQVLIMCLDGKTDHRVWIGCLYGQFLPHTMPHGRFSSDDRATSQQNPAGPFDSFERRIEPLSSNFKDAFPNTQDENFEFRTRAADYQVAGIVKEKQLNQTFSRLLDDSDRGYSLSRLDPELKPALNLTPANFDNMVTSIVSPGFHAISMDDRIENGRMRLRTTAGHQVILDDTNERIYISTAKGKNWVEIDQEGNIDVYTEGKMSVNAERDINFNTKGSFRVNADRGIHMRSGKEVRVTSKEDISMRSETDMRFESVQNIIHESKAANISMKASQQVFVETVKGNLNLRSGANLLNSSQRLTSFDTQTGFVVGADTIQLGGGSVVVSGSTIDLNGSSATLPTPTKGATSADVKDERLAFYPNRIPEHEPWARGSNDDVTGTAVFEYDDARVGVLEFATGDDGRSSDERNFKRGSFWRR